MIMRLLLSDSFILPPVYPSTGGLVLFRPFKPESSYEVHSVLGNV